MAFRTHMKSVRIVNLILVVLILILKKAECKECYYSIHTSDTTRSKTEITSPNYPDDYPNGYTCSWKLENIPGCKIKILFDDLQLEPCDDCMCDYVSIFDGHNQNDPLLGRYCQLNHFRSVISNSHRIMLLFRSDGSQAFKGFRVNYLTECEHHVRTSEITSPNYPNNYPVNYLSSWKFETIPGCKIKLEIHDLQLRCCGYVELFDGHNRSDPDLGRYHDLNEYRPVISTSHKMMLFFRSDKSRASRGFKATYSTECVRFLPTTGYVQDFGLSQLSIDNIADAHNYTWIFETTMDHTIKLEFDSFQLPEINHLRHGDCTLNYVAFYDGKTVNNPLLGRFCSVVPSSFSSRSHRILMTMKLTGISPDIKFSAKYWAEFNLKIIPDETKRSFINYFLKTRQNTRTINKWGPDIARTAVALLLHDPQFFVPGNETGEEIAYELTLQLKSKLVLRKQISTPDLALFVNALKAACIDPTNFFGVNIVAELRKRVDDSNYTNPFVILTLCNAGEKVEMEDVRKLQQLFGKHLQPCWTDIQAMIVMALKCISKQSNMNLDTTLNDMVSHLKSKQQTSSTIDNLKNTALLIQAIIATENFRTDFNFSNAIHSMLNGIKHADRSVEEMYYILPVLTWKTLLNISSDHCNDIIKTDLEEPKRIRKQIDDRIKVEFSIVIGDDMEFLQTFRVLIPSNYTFYQVLENITTSELNCKVQYVFSNGKPYLAGLGNFQNSMDTGKFWFTYNRSSSGENPTLIKKSPVDIYINVTHNLLLWYKSLSWSSIQDISTDVTDSSSYTFVTTEVTDSPSYTFDTTEVTDSPSYTFDTTEITDSPSYTFVTTEVTDSPSYTLNTTKTNL